MTIIIPDSILVSDVKRLTNQLWKLIPMRENEENWIGQLDSLYIEISGLGNLAKINEDENFLILLSKLEGLRVKDSSFSVYRKTVFECISLLRELRL